MEMEQKREQLLGNAMRRKEVMDRKREQMEAKAMQKKLADEKKLELAEQKKMEKEMHRQRIREEYDRRKAEQAAMENSLTSPSPRSPSKSVNRGKSQPPARPKSQIIDSKSAGMKSAGSQQRLNKSVIGDTFDQPASQRARPNLSIFRTTTPRRPTAQAQC